ncbi:hypothetical protein [Kibdelosporangium philippinense]|uniref:hypothetical protein n=1 Tax=Kibdelosporangium philippinense TaxID=211113 RepID=UPI00361D8725
MHPQEPLLPAELQAWFDEQPASCAALHAKPDQTTEHELHGYTITFNSAVSRVSHEGRSP